MRNQSYRWLIQQSKPAHRWLFLTILAGVFSGILFIAQASLLAKIIDRVYLHHANRHMLAADLFFLIVIILLRSCFAWCREKIAFKTSAVIKKITREKLTTHLFTLSPIQIQGMKTGDLTTKLIEQIEALHGFFADYLPQMTIAVLLPLVIVGFVFSQNWMCGLILLLTAPLIPLFMALIGMGTEKLNQENFQALAEMSAHFLDRLRGLTTLSLFHCAYTQLNSIADTTNQYREKTMRILRIAFLSTATLELFSTVSIAIIAVYLGLGLLGFIKFGFGHSAISLQHAFFILLLAPEFFMPLRQLGAFYHARSEAMGAASEITSLLSLTSIIKSNEKTSLFSANRITLHCDNLVFCYDQKKILSDFSMHIKAGECVAINGPSGSGKTTILALIAQFLSPDSGRITANDMDLQEMDPDSWRNHFGFLQQHTRLWHGTIKDNIRLAKPNASDTEIKKAADIAGVTAFAQHFPLSLNTLIHEHNNGLSGGQIQRVALARLYLKNAPFILLDEPTNYLDEKNVSIVLSLLSEWKKDKTIIIATHDQRILNHVDRVIAVKSDQTSHDRKTL